MRNISRDRNKCGTLPSVIIQTLELYHFLNSYYETDRTVPPYIGIYVKWLLQSDLHDTENSNNEVLMGKLPKWSDQANQVQVW